jgi:hypothetical protein
VVAVNMSQRDFYQRFGFTFDPAEARRRFVNRAYNQIFDRHIAEIEKERPAFTIDLLSALEDFFGEWNEELPYFPFLVQLDSYTRRDFYLVLQVIELLWAIHPHASWEDPIVNAIIEKSEVPLGITFRSGKFYPEGDKALDEKLVSEPLARLKSLGFSAAAMPFEKALHHLLAGKGNDSVLADAITDSYEALEAMAKIITGLRERVLDDNADLFVSKLNISDEYKKILKRCVHYAHRFRHAPTEEKPRPKLTYKEAESYVYITGLFLRLATG